MNSPDDYRVLCGMEDPLQAVHIPALQPFASQVLDFLADLSAALLRNKQARAYSDVISFAFFCRRANLELLQKPYDDLEARLGRGLVFHIAPGNVPMNFAYSLLSALLAGNASIVKAPSKPFAQVSIVCNAMQALLAANHQSLKPYINVIEYPRERQDITEAFSAQCDARIIWGGDETIRRVRMAQLSPRAFDITFADRWSLAVLETDAIIRMDDAEITDLAKGFYNDTYLYDQNACTSPRLCVWMGERSSLEAAQTRFWDTVHAQASARYTLDAVTAVDKLTELYRAAVLNDGIVQEKTVDNLLTRVRLTSLTADVINIHCTGGCFLEYHAAALAELIPVLTPKTQTIACAGIAPSVVRAFIRQAGVKGVDRVVRIGHTMDFSLIWDGYDLIRTLSRMVN